MDARPVRASADSERHDDAAGEVWLKRQGVHGGVPPGRADYLPDSRILTPADKAERDALLQRFGANLRRARLAAGMTQRELATRSDITNVSFVSRLEVGTRSPNLVQLAMFTHALDVSYDALLRSLPTPLRERSTRTVIALVRREPGIDAGDLAAHLHVKASYVRMLGRRLSLEGRLRHDGQHFWPVDSGTVNM
jgi:transcriptional regulator with XRE-family HTH domain